ncbi:bifunctional serine/threonine protein kinase/MFS transporter [Streptomyces misionensis]
MRGQLLGGRYRLVRQLGEGGMGQVWEAQDETLGRAVAVKLISLLAGGGSRGDEVRARFLREARITAQLQHPNIVTIHDLGETDTGGTKVPFLVMERVRGEGLDALLRRGVVTLSDAARWGEQICDALAEAHSAGIMHRDIKPSNILITPSGVVKVLDFGIARAADPYATGDRLTQTGFIVGTPPYMAPEQARGFPEPRSDLYALGCVLFELITGRLPFQAPDTVGYLTAHLAQEPPAPSSVSTDIPRAWDELVLTLLRKDPQQRYPTAADLSRALRRLDHAFEPVPSTGEPAPPPTVPALDAPVPVPDGSPPPHRWSLVVIALAQSAVLLGAPVGGRYGFDHVNPLVFHAFTVAFGGLLLPGGHIADLVGRRRTLVIGLSGFAVASLICGAAVAFPLSSAMPAVILGRGLQGGFGALVTTAALAMVVTGFPGPGERVRAFGVYAAVSVGGPVLGLLTGGSLPAGPIFGCTLFFALFALGGVRVLPHDALERPGTDTTKAGVRFDLPGVLLGSLGPAALTFGLTRAQWWTGWADQWVIGLLAIGLVLLTAFLRWQSHASSPLLSPHVLRDRGRLGGFLVVSLIGVGVLSLMPPLAHVIGSGTAGLTDRPGIGMLPMLAATVTGSTLIAPRLLSHAAPPHRLIVAGCVITLLGLAPSVAAFGAEAPYALLLPCVVLTGLGIGLVFTPLFACVTAGVIPQHAGAAAGAVIAAQNIGQGIGTTVYSSLNGPPWWAVLCLLLAGLTAGWTKRTGTSDSLVPSGG